MSYRGWLALVSTVAFIGCAQGRSDEDAAEGVLDPTLPDDSLDDGWDDGWDDGCCWESGGWETGGDQPPIEDTRPLVIADPAPPPITGGGILVLQDGTTAVISDPERDLVHVVDLGSRIETSAIALPAGAQPWRAVEDLDGTVHVVLRGSASVATIDLLAGVVLADRSVCTTPRGIALAPTGDGTLVACAGGELWRLTTAANAGEPFATLEADLRDVIVGPDGLVRVTRFRSAEVLTLDADGAIVDRGGPHSTILVGVATGAGGPMLPNTAWHTIATDDGGWLMVHQHSREQPVDLDAAAPWGGLGPCESIVQSTATMQLADGTVVNAGALDTAALPVDIAFDAASERMVVAVAAGCTLECDTPDVLFVDVAGFGEPGTQTCREPIALDLGDIDAQMIAVAFTQSGDLLVQQRDPAVLWVVDELGASTSIALGGDMIEDTGHRLFHEVGRAGLACASCHPEGGDDGHVWTFGLDVRHTPALFSGLAGTAPLHWAGGFADFAALVAEVHLDRMGMMIEPPDHTAAFEAWVTALRTPAPRAADDPAALAGRDVFLDLRCDLCHTGEATTNNLTVALTEGGLPLQIPPLHGVALHPPYFHDGRAATLADAVAQMVGISAPQATPTAAEIADLVAYLESL